MAAVVDFSDTAVVILLMSQGKTKNQAESAINLLKTFRYDPKERHRILSNKNSFVHTICYFGSVWPPILIIGSILVPFSVFLRIKNWNFDVLSTKKFK